MSNLIGFRPKDHNIPDDGYNEPLLPTGKHPAMCIKIVEGVNTNGNPYVQYTWQIIPPSPFAGTKINNFEYPTANSEVAQAIYLKKLKSLMTICGCGEVLNSLDELQMRPLLINIKHRTGQNGETRNSINYYTRIDAGTSTPVAPPTSPVPPVPPNPVSIPNPVPPVPNPVPNPVPTVPVQSPVPSPVPVMQPAVQPPGFVHSPVASPGIATNSPVVAPTAPPVAPTPSPVPNPLPNPVQTIPNPVPVPSPVPPPNPVMNDTGGEQAGYFNDTQFDHIDDPF